MKAIIRRITVLMLVVACILQSSSWLAFAVGEEETAQAEQTDAAETGDTEQAEAGTVRHNYVLPDDSIEITHDDSDMNRKNTTNIKFSFLDTGGRANTWTFPYSDSFFRMEPDEYSYLFAQGSLGFAASAARSNPKVVQLQYKTYLTKAGFENLDSFGYGRPTTADTLSGVIGMKQVDDFVVIAAVTCGQGYKNEWAGNMKVGKGERHQGFEEASTKLESHLAKYIRDNNIDGKKKLWLTGMSRAGAIGNITAADAIESGEYEDVYAYLFGVPRTTKKPIRYAGIYNICGQYDPVAAVPFESWGFERYGMDLYTPAQESDTLFVNYVFSAVDIGEELDGKGFRNNPEVNYQLRLIIEWMSEFFRDADEYTDRIQPLLMKAVLNHGEDELLQIIMEAFNKLQPEDEGESESIRVFVNYISYMIAQHTRADVRQIDDGSWDPTESVAANFVIEHRPSTYLRWLFSDCIISDPEEISISSRRLTVQGDATVLISRDGMGITEIDSKGNITAPDPEVDPAMSGERGVFSMRNGQETIVSIPDDHEYYVEISSTGDQYVAYYDVKVAPNKLVSEPGRYHMGQLKNATVGFKVEPGKDLAFEPDVLSGTYDSFGTAGLSYSPTNIMADELAATKYTHITLETAYNLLRRSIIAMVVLLLTCFIIWRLHRRGRKKGHGPYSDWYVIVPHLILIAGFAGLTQFFTYYFYTVKGVRVISATVAMFFIFLLAARGAIRSRNSENGLLAGVLLMGVPLVYTYYNKLKIDSFSNDNAIIFFIAVALLTFLAIRCFRPEGALKFKVRKGKKAEGEPEAEPESETKPESEQKPADKKAPATEKKPEPVKKEKKASATKKTPAKKSTSKKTAAKKESSTSKKKSPAKKTTTKKESSEAKKKAPAKKSPAKKKSEKPAEKETLKTED